MNEDEAVYLTKNGYGSMAVMSIEKYSNLLKEIDIEKSLNARFGNNNIELKLEEAEKEYYNPKTKHLTHEEVMKRARGIIYGEN